MLTWMVERNKAPTVRIEGFDLVILMTVTPGARESQVFRYGDAAPHRRYDMFDHKGFCCNGQRQYLHR